MINKLYDLNPNLLNKICDLKDYMRNNNLKRLPLDVSYINEIRQISIMLNDTTSPDGAKGMFLLLPRNWVIYHPHPQDILNHLIYNGYLNIIEAMVINNQEEFNNMYPDNRQRIQEQFEFYTYQILKNNGISVNCVKECDNVQENGCINEFDFIVNCQYGLEVKSDRYMRTGNLSLELLRDYRVECQNNISNIGSILKTKADFWQEYFYDRREQIFATELYSTEILQNFTKYYIDLFHTHYIIN